MMNISTKRYLARLRNMAYLPMMLIVLFSSVFSNAQRTLGNDLLAWCIVPFDIKERTPAQRIAMLQKLGFDKYAYDWRERHLEEMSVEWQLAKDAGIEVCAVWMWLDARVDQVGQLSKSNEAVLQSIAKTNLQTDIWLGLNSNYFEGLNDDQALEKAVQTILYLASRLGPLGCKLALYNHGGWFGQPLNQVNIIKALPEQKIGIVYNFHHAHEHLEDFDHLVDLMLPHLRTVNLNGMRKEGPKILPIGTGDLEKSMIKLLLDKGYDGPFGILGHVAEADVEVILAQNLEGLKSLN